MSQGRLVRIDVAHSRLARNAAEARPETTPTQDESPAHLPQALATLNADRLGVGASGFGSVVKLVFPSRSEGYRTTILILELDDLKSASQATPRNL